MNVIVSNVKSSGVKDGIIVDIDVAANQSKQPLSKQKKKAGIVD